MSEVTEENTESGTSGVQRDERGRIVAGTGSLNPSGRPKGKAWTSILRELAETRTRGGGGMTRAHRIIDQVVKKAEEGDLQAVEMLWSRLEGKPTVVQAVDHTTGGQPLAANISFTDVIDVTPDTEEK